MITISLQDKMSTQSPSHYCGIWKKWVSPWIVGHHGSQYKGIYKISVKSIKINVRCPSKARQERLLSLASWRMSHNVMSFQNQLIQRDEHDVSNISQHAKRMSKVNCILSTANWYIYKIGDFTNFLWMMTLISAWLLTSICKNKDLSPQALAQIVSNHMVQQ